MNDDMTFTNVKYIADNGQNISIEFEMDGTIMHVSASATGNRHYDEIMKQVAAGDLTIADAD